MLSVTRKLRNVFFGIIMLGLFLWQFQKVSADWWPVFHYTIVVVAFLAVINEIIYVRCISRFFDSVDAEVIPQSEAREGDLTVTTYLLRFQYDGLPHAATFGDNVLSNAIGGKTSCRILVNKKDHRILLIDSFKLRYLNLIISILLFCSMFTLTA